MRTCSDLGSDRPLSKVVLTLPAGASAQALRLSVTRNTGWIAAQLS